MTDLREVAVLCVAPRSIYKALPGVVCYDAKRDARTFAGGMPVVAHPPCRLWSPRLRHQAKPSVGEQELGLWCADQVQQCGGILEQPVDSLLWDAARLPQPGSPRGPLDYSLAVWQSWWGFPCQKATILYFRGIPMKAIEIPFCLYAPTRQIQNMSHAQRGATILPFAKWLVALARKARV